MRRRKITRFAKNNDGVSLVELIVAVAMLAVIMTPFMRTFLMALRVSDSSKDYSASTLQVGNVIESVKNANASTLSTDLVATYGELKSTDAQLADGVYVYANGDQTVVVTNRTIEEAYDEYKDSITGPGMSADDAEKLADKEFGFLKDLDATDLSVYTNMDATLVQAAGAIEVTSTETGVERSDIVIRDIDIIAYEEMKSALGMTDASQIKRRIEVDITQSGTYLTYKVTYNYWWRTSPNAGWTNPDWSGILFEESITPGTDGIYAIQLVYVPMNLQTAQNPSSPSDAESFVINYKMGDTDTNQVRFFLIKQVRCVHAVGCSNGYDKYDVIDEDSAVLLCGTTSDTGCANEGYDNEKYTAKIYLNGDDDDLEYIGLQSNIAVNAYTGVEIPRASNHFKYIENSGTEKDLVEGLNLVYDSQGGRISLVTVNIYDQEFSSSFDATTSKLLSSMQTLKLS